MAKLICKYSKCGKEYTACADSVKFGSYKSCGCCIQHFCKYQNQVYFFRGEELPYPDLIAEMVKEGSLPESILTKEIK